MTTLQSWFRFICLLFLLLGEFHLSARAQERVASKDRSESASTGGTTDATVTVPVSDGAEARAKALELAGAFSNEGYKIRDGYWLGVLEPKKPIFLEVNLFAGNRYWFCLGANDNARKLSVTLFDENGKALEGELFESGAMAASGWIAEVSGRYFVRLELLEGTPSEVCFLYTYK